MSARTAALLLLIAALAATSANDVIARSFGLGREGLGFGKMGAAGKQGSNGIPPVNCGTGVIDASAGCALPMLGS